MIGSLPWAAPEVVGGEPYTEMSDVFSLGRVFWELVSHQIPFAGKNELFIISSIVENNHPPFPAGTSPAFVSLAESMLVEEPSARPDIYVQPSSLPPGHPSLHRLWLSHFVSKRILISKS